MKRQSPGHVTNAETNDRNAYYALLRDLLKDKQQKLQEYADYVPTEIVYKALIIREFMELNDISDVHQGVRRFTAFERERLQRLHIV